ncbi:MAG: hypothetical protein ACKPKO_50475, partial [Candidatus Fonsibacter sp.]
TPDPGALHASTSPQDSPLDHTRACRCLGPDETRHAMIFSIANAVRTQHNSRELWNAWKWCALTTTITFKYLGTAEKRLWYALQQRENISTMHIIMHR